ncbi:MAG TPA: phosphoglucosamine mutase [Pirellulales bacterium]|nr:phosphoglucosamine mutase [Pirellulales bacterium]
MHEPIISVSGLRGVVGVSLTPLVALRYATAFAETAPAGPIVVTQDGRATGGMLADVIRGGLAAAGRDVIDAGIAATPTTGVLVRQFSAAGGIQISASHNPPEYNGLKLFSREGRVVPAEFGQRVLTAYRAERSGWVGHERIGERRVCNETSERHLELVLATVDAGRIRRRKFKVLLDSNHGSGSVLGHRLLEALGCETTVLGGEPDGRFEHTPEPLAENLAGVASRAVDSHVDVGFCQDPDADRLAVIDERGRYIGEEYTLAICAAHWLARHPGPVVTNCSTSRMTEDVAGKFGVSFFRSAVGEANVVDCMLAHDAVLGGEGNGGVIHPQVGYVRDSFVGMALVLDAMAAREAPLSRLADELPRYEIVKTKIDLPAERVAAGLDRLARHFREAQADRLDGLRLDWPGKWLLVRPSNTEPIVRAIAEAPTRDEAQRLCDESAKVLKG